MHVYPTGRKFSLEFKFCYFADGKFAKFKFRFYSFFKNFSMIAYIIEIQKSKLANIQFHEFDQSSQVAKFNS